MAEKACVKRLQKEYRALCKEPVSNVVARPLPNDILEWLSKMFIKPPYNMNKGTRPLNFFFDIAQNYSLQLLNRYQDDSFAKNILCGGMWYFLPFDGALVQFDYVLEGSEGTPFAGGYYYGKIKFPPEYPFKPPGISMTTPNGRFMTQKKICLSMSDFHPESWNPMWSVSSILTGLLSFMMDTSPTTGSVTTTIEEKHRLAKASLAFNCKNATFRKLFPEYVEKYEQQQLPKQLVQEQDVSLLTQRTGSKPLLNGNSTVEETNAVEAPNGMRNRRQSFPTWVVVLLVSIFAAVMALPLLQL